MIIHLTDSRVGRIYILQKASNQMNLSKAVKNLMVRNLEATIAELCERHETADRVTRRIIERQVKGAREEIRELA